MALPSSGPISLKQVRDELKLSGSINLGQQEVRNLAKIPSGRISMSDLRGKSAREWDQDFKDKYGNQYKGEYKENNSYNIDLAKIPSGRISMSDLRGKSAREWDQDFKDKYGNQYKGEYKENNSYNIGDIVGMKDLEEALVFEVTVPYNRENPDLSSFRKFYKIKEKMAFRKIRDNYWDIIFEEEEQLNFSTTTFIEGQRAYSSTVDNYYPYSHIKRVLLKNGVEQYELNDTDSTKKKDGSPAKLDGTDGDVMVRIPKFYGEVFAQKLDGTDGDVMVRIPKFYGEVFAQDNNDRRYRIYNYHNPTKKIALGVKIHPYFVNSLGGYYDNRYNAAYFGSLNKSNQLISAYHNPTKKIALGVKIHPYFVNSLGGYYDNRYNAAYFGSLNKSNQLISASNVIPLSMVSIPEFSDYVHQGGRNNNYHSTSMLEWSTTHFLYTIEFANLDSQKIIGKGYKYLNITGASNIIGNGTGKLSNERNSYRGMEDLFGSGYYHLIGTVAKNNSIYYTSDLNNLLNDNKMNKIKSGYSTDVEITEFNYAENIRGYEELLIPEEKWRPGSYYCDSFEILFGVNFPIFAIVGGTNGEDFGGLSHISYSFRDQNRGSAFGCRLSYANMI